MAGKTARLKAMRKAKFRRGRQQQHQDPAILRRRKHKRKRAIRKLTKGRA